MGRVTERITLAAPPATELAMKAKFDSLGNLKFLGNNTWHGLIFHQAVVLFFCSVGKNNWSWTQKCYDNTFADSVLGGGTPSGYFGYFDLFTWGGLFWMTMFYLID